MTPTERIEYFLSMYQKRKNIFPTHGYGPDINSVKDWPIDLGPEFLGYLLAHFDDEVSDNFRPKLLSSVSVTVGRWPALSKQAWVRIDTRVRLAALEIGLLYDFNNVVQPVIDLMVRRLRYDEPMPFEWKAAAERATKALKTAEEKFRAVKASQAKRAALEMKAADVAAETAWTRDKSWGVSRAAARAVYGSHEIGQAITDTIARAFIGAIDAEIANL